MEPRSTTTPPEFEELRRAQETKNEIIANAIQMVVLVAAFGINLATRFRPIAPYRAPGWVLALIAAIFLVRLAIVVYLRRDPPYAVARKYLISAFDVLFFTLVAAGFTMMRAYPPTVVSLFNVCTFAMAIAISGLRYSTQLVAWTGAATIVVHTVFFGVTLDPAFRLPAIMIGLIALGCLTVCTAYSVASLIRIHREAAMKENLARFLSPELVEQIVKQPELMQRASERRTATVIFTDIRGFTRFSENMPPERVVAFLNQFLEEMTGAIMDHKGMLDKYIGDCVMGVFGVPFHADDHAVRALRSALDMRERLKRLNVTLEQDGLPELSVGIGLHTGELLIGAIGSTRRLDYTVIGDTVNVASRIEGMTRSYPVEILLSDSTREALDGAVDVYEIATVQVKNRTEGLRLWSPDPPVAAFARA